MRRPATLHRLLDAGAQAFNRNPWTSVRIELVPRDTGVALIPSMDVAFYAEDYLWTPHGHPFVADERFNRAYQRAVQAGGFDYGIRWRTHVILWAASVARSVDGAFVECGTGRGFMASAICEYLEWHGRPFYLYDTFESNWIDPATGERIDAPRRTYATSADDVRQNFEQWPGVRLVVGELPATLVEGPDRIAFLHVDLNHAPPEQAVVRHFWHRMEAGSVLIFDDYGIDETIRRAADDVAAELGFSICASPTGQGIVFKTTQLSHTR